MDKELYKNHSEVCKVFSNPARLEILDLLRGKGASVSELTRRTGLSQANVSQHLSIMKSKGIVSYRRKGKNIYYAISNPKVVKAFDLMREALVENLGRRFMGMGG
ncbi:helix-turn-helix transcriptional regulator [Candidatus Micrarchaeota archaeon]|nr:helix-turn-helix transcriptional regulator [Candidatus Micrarchaeota archaeon]